MPNRRCIRRLSIREWQIFLYHYLWYFIFCPKLLSDSHTLDRLWSDFPIDQHLYFISSKQSLTATSPVRCTLSNQTAMNVCYGCQTPGLLSRTKMCGLDITHHLLSDMPHNLNVLHIKFASRRQALFRNKTVRPFRINSEIGATCFTKIRARGLFFLRFYISTQWQS